MTSLEGLIRELFFKPNIWKRLIIAIVLFHFLLGFGYLRQIAKTAAENATPELPPIKGNREFWKKSFAAIPLGAFYLGVPIFLAWGTAHLLDIVGFVVLGPVIWGLGFIAALTMTSVALVTVKEDEERFFLSLEFETILKEWWELKRVWILPAIFCYGFIVIFGLPIFDFRLPMGFSGIYFCGVTGFLSLALLICYLSLSIRNQRYA